MRTPLAWHNLVHKKSRTLVAGAGVTFAITLIFMQMGFFGGVLESAVLIYRQMEFDLLLTSTDYVNLTQAGTFTDRRAYQALSLPEVQDAVPVYLNRIMWRNPDTRLSRSVIVIGFNPDKRAFRLPEIQQQQHVLVHPEKLGPLEIQANEAKVRLLAQDWEMAQTDWKRVEGITTPGIVAPQQRDHQRQQVQRAKEQLTSAQASLEQVKAGHQSNLAEAKAKVQTAQANLTRTRKAVPLDSLEKKLAAADAALDNTILHAPRKGRILIILTRPGEPLGQQPILKMGDTDAMYAVAEVYETDIALVQKGQKAVITSPALGRPLHGTVEQKGLMIFKMDVLHIDPAADADARVVEVRIRLDEADLGLVGLAKDLTNLQVDVRIYLDQAEAVSSRPGSKNQFSQR